MEPDTLYRAVASRDRRFEGRFVVAVTSTGIYCRPGCPAKIAAAQERARSIAIRRRPRRPASAPARAAAPTPCAWSGTSSTVKRALAAHRRAARSATTASSGWRSGSASAIATCGGCSRRTSAPRRCRWRRRAARTSRASSSTRRSSPLAEIAFAAGFGSVRRFNAAMRRAFGRTPTELRARARGGRGGDGGGADADAAVPRAVRVGAARRVPGRARHPGRRGIAAAGRRRLPPHDVSDGGVVSVRADGETTLQATLRVPSARGLRDAVERIRRLFDVARRPARHRRRRWRATRRCARPCAPVPGGACPAAGTASNWRSAPSWGSRCR